MRSIGSIGAIVGLVSMLICGCDTTPRGDSGGRIDSYSTTLEERSSGGANVSSMLQFSDTVAEQLAQDISQIPEFRDASTQLVRHIHCEARPVAITQSRLTILRRLATALHPTFGGRARPD